MLWKFRWSCNQMSTLLVTPYIDQLTKYKDLKLRNQILTKEPKFGPFNILFPIFRLKDCLRFHNIQRTIYFINWSIPTRQYSLRQNKLLKASQVKTILFFLDDSKGRRLEGSWIINFLIELIKCTYFPTS